MEQVHAQNPKDREAAIFYALALLGAAPPTDKTYAKQKKAGGDPQRACCPAPRITPGSRTT